MPDNASGQSQLATDSLGQLISGLEDLVPDLEEFYYQLHRYPELAFQETKPAAAAARRLRGLGFEVTTGIGQTGVVGVLRNGDGPTVMLRADMDALPVAEETGLGWASRQTAEDSDGRRVPVMHACGHDMHVACLVGACALFAGHAAAWRGTLVAVFQPGEESGHGARAMVADGLFERFPRPDVLLGQHVGPAPVGVIAHCPGTFLGATDSIKVRLFGRGGHGSKPHAAIDPVVMAASMVLRLQNVVSREIAPQNTAVMTVGSLHAGTTAAVIPPEAELAVNIRSFDPRDRDHMISAVTRIAEAETLALRGTKEPEITHVYHLPVTFNEPETTERVLASHTEHFGEDAVFRIGPQSASEDFSVLADAAQVPSVFWIFGGIEPDVFTKAFMAGRVEQDVPQNHSPTFAPVPRPTLTSGIRSLVSAAMSWLTPERPQTAGPTESTTAPRDQARKVYSDAHQ
jgi:amidohydrolase